MINKEKVFTAIFIASIFYVIGLFWDFQNLKGAVSFIEKKVEYIEQDQAVTKNLIQVNKDLQCEIAIEIFRQKDKPKTILRHCR